MILSNYRIIKFQTNFPIVGNFGENMQNRTKSHMLNLLIKIGNFEKFGKNIQNRTKSQNVIN